MLNTILHGQPTDEPALLIAHGLFGSGRNWGVIAKRLSDTRQVIAVDMRNHGASPRFERQRYEDMAQDLAEVIEAHGGPVDVLGHSMGGKAAMALALSRPDLVNRLIVADIAPVAYSHSQMHNVEAMQALDLSQVDTRADAAEALSKLVEDPALVPFFLQSLDVREKRWRLNFEALARDMDAILGFPEFDTHFGGPTLFLTGANSDYVTPEHRPRIAALFPKARFVKLSGAGHWLHADKPREFEAALRAWLSQA
ncbi:alpha/beta fold hydrolase [Rhodalgimonas zhirmunskyi]|uniref:Alpha/beta fold hydrolase n=1 Tax=Rhodalgimonas zhirmunskyi TaxID=2964767 RepID=A0AAJ1UC16_9RHOB|nr:alpha/beta fold hydrolase [Rhodoalgimonas zhirmunskyi]MDQ2094758.1 alpha/beta fold hydrolase [Rhodoalgimonas zhirmunskyi]